VVVGRLRRPHGLKGEVTVFPLTDDPAALFGPERRLWRLALDGTVLGEPVVVERGRPYHREWLLKFVGIDRREDLEGWKGQLLGVPATELPPLREGEVYLGELAGFGVRDPAGAPLGLVTGVLELPAGPTLEIQGARREFLLPFRKEFVLEVNRAERRLTVRVPDGLLDAS
jgi:16S rRNA processing protein RimM